MGAGGEASAMGSPNERRTLPGSGRADEASRREQPAGLGEEESDRRYDGKRVGWTHNRSAARPGECRCRPFGHGHRDGTAELDHRGRREATDLGVEHRDLD